MPKNTFFNLDSEKQEQILNAGLDLFANLPYKKVSIDKIVEKASIPKGSFYQYFSNKDDFYKHLFKTISLEKKQVLEASFEQLKEQSFTDCMRSMYQAGMTFDHEKPKDLKDRFLFECKKDLQEVILEEMINESNKIIEDILIHYQDKGQIKSTINIKLTAEMLTALSIHFGKSLQKSNASQEELLKTIDDMLRVIEEGVL